MRAVDFLADCPTSIYKRRVIKAIAILTMLLAANASFGADPTTAPVVPDKSGYTLFNPVPTDQLRSQDSDRPNKTNTPHTIDAGHLQIESGVFDFNFIRNQISNTSISVAQENFRLGITNYLEVNAAISFFNSLPVANANGVGSSRHNGIGDLYLGGKLNLWGDDSNDEPWSSALAIQPQFKTPSSSGRIGNGHFEANVGFPFLMNLPMEFHLGLETLLSDQRNLSNTAAVLGWQNSMSVDRVFFEKYDVYLEYWAGITAEHHTKAQETIDVGVVYSLSDSVALDTGVNFGLNNASTDYEWVGGITVRF